MEEFEFNLTPLLSLLIFIFLWFITTTFLKPAPTRKLPPSPSKLPIIGNLHQLGTLPHRSLHSLAKKHGPLMLLHFGSVPVLIVSSAEWAREIMKTHDLIFASRPPYKMFDKLTYGFKNVGTAPYGEYWRKMRSIFALHLLSNKRVESSRCIREEETAAFVKKIEESSGAVDLSALFAQYTTDGVGRAAFGKRYSESENGKKFLRVMSDFMDIVGMINIAEFIPWLGWIDRFNGFNKRLDRTAREMDEVLERVIQERLHDKTQNQQIEENILDILLEMYKGNAGDASIARDSLKALIMDVFIGGTDTVSTTLEWIMSELLLHPSVMEKLQREVRGIVKQKHSITEDDIEKMHYLKAVIKDVLRYHTPGPLLVPRIASQDVQVNGYDVSAGTVVIINAWAIGRDPDSWDEPEKFMPERFLNSTRDFRGLDFEFIPFGAGRRGCPGITYATVVVELLIANLMQRFDWKLADGKDLDMNESPGITAHRVVPLLAIASKCM